MYKSERHFGLDNYVKKFDRNIAKSIHQRNKPRLTLARIAKAVWYGICIGSTGFVVYALCDAASRVN